MRVSRHRFDRLEFGGITPIFKLGFHRESNGDCDRRVAPDLKGERPAPAQPWREPVAEQPHEIADVLAPLCGAQIGFVGVKLLVKGEDITQHCRAFQQGDPRIIRGAVRPALQHGIVIQAAEHRLQYVGIAADAVRDAFQARAVMDAPGELDRLVAVVTAVGRHRRPPCTSNVMNPRSI